MTNEETNEMEEMRAYNKAKKLWEKRKLIEVNNVPFDKDCVDLIITKPNTNSINEPLFATIFNVFPVSSLKLLRSSPKDVCLFTIFIWSYFVQIYNYFSNGQLKSNLIVKVYNTNII